MNNEKLLRLKDVKEITGLKHSKLYHLISEGLFPRPVKIGICAHWPESRVRKWVDDIIAESDAMYASADNKVSHQGHAA